MMRADCYSDDQTDRVRGHIAECCDWFPDDRGGGQRTGTVLLLPAVIYWAHFRADANAYVCRIRDNLRQVVFLSHHNECACVIIC
jgi:hypothetical protein